MIWPVYLAALWLMLGLDVGLRTQLQLGPSSAPSLTLVLVTFVAMWAPKIHALYAALLAGVCLDLLGTHVAPGGTSAVSVVGPGALGAVLGALTVLTMRAMVERSNLFALPTLAVVQTALTGLVIVFCFSVRSVYDPSISFDAVPELLSRGLSALATGVAAVPLSLLLRPAGRLFGFSASHTRRPRGW